VVLQQASNELPALRALRDRRRAANTTMVKETPQEETNMKALITDYHESTNCTWCEKTNEAITVQFEGGFLQKGPLCWKCLQQATRVHHKQDSATSKPPANNV
jgi:hypothetical protein